MGSRRDWRRVGAASATVSAGAVVFFAVGAGPVSAETSTTVRTAGECKLGPLLCSILNGGKGAPSSPPKSSGGGSSSKPTTKPNKPSSSKPKPRAKPKPRPASHSSHSGSGSGSGGGYGGSGTVSAPIAPPAAPAGTVPDVAAPQEQGPALPDIVGQDPLVYPQGAPAGQDQATPARLVAASDPESDATVPPLLVATASGLIGAVTALNLSVLGRRLRRPR